MKEWLDLVTNDAVVIINAMALVIVVIGTAEAFFTGLWAAFPAPAHRRFREILVRYGRWLVAGLTFQLAADIIGTSVAPSWEELGRLGAILNFFLERDLAELGIRTRQAMPTDARSARGGRTLVARPVFLQ
jgi:uncharacterized membrane protein